jgi:predicted nucleic acid-binding protein
LKIYYLDASAWVKRYYQEAGTAIVQSLFDNNSVLACSSLGVVEVSATLARKRKSAQITQANFLQMHGELLVDWRFFIQVQFSNEVQAESLNLTTMFSLRGADAVHLASAKVLERYLDSSDQYIFVSSDQELTLTASEVGLVVIDPTMV